MQTIAEDLIAAVLSRTIDRQEAMRRFAALAGADKERVMTVLKSQPLAQLTAATQPRRLRMLDERDLDERHDAFLRDLIRAYESRVPISKRNAATRQFGLVDARKVSNLKKKLKALQFHLTWDRAEGACLYDVDGNEYVDITGDHGVNIFGSQPDFVKAAVTERLRKGYPLLGYTDEVFEASELFCELTGHERVAFTQSGTEAVVLAVRIARAATQKSKIVVFEGSFHGLSDTVAAVQGFGGKSVAAGLGIPQEYADQLMVLEYGNMAHLRLIEQHAAEIAGVLVEPVQSGQPHVQPVQFLRDLRKLTLERQIPLIFDEMITGFRVCPRGAQGHFAVVADIATYGKIPGGGLPTGMVAGPAKYMDFIDGGSYELEDESMPKMRRVYIGGTHTRNPIKVAATLATLREIKARCPGTLDCATCSCFQKELNARTQALVEELNTYLSQARVPIVADCFSSLFKLRLLHTPFGIVRELLLVLMRMNGVEPSFSGNFFITTAHSDDHLARIVSAVKAAVDTLLTERFFTEAETKTEDSVVAEESKHMHAALRAAPAVTAPGSLAPELARLKQTIKAELESALKGGR